MTQLGAIGQTVGKQGPLRHHGYLAADSTSGTSLSWRPQGSRTAPGRASHTETQHSPASQGEPRARDIGRQRESERETHRHGERWRGGGREREREKQRETERERDPDRESEG